MTMRIEIDIKDDITPVLALECVKLVVKRGKISNNGKNYCYATMLNSSVGDILVQTIPNRKNDCFVVRKHTETENKNDEE